ncbi:hypothetical protein KAH81_01000 [bacterium]|nr:hypothetical protein [bacterium]
MILNCSLKKSTILFFLAAAVSALTQIPRGIVADPEFKIYPFLRVVEGVSLPFVEEAKQNPSPYWDICTGFSYEYLTVGIAARSHFLSSTSDSFYHPETEIFTEGHTAMLVAHVEGKADVRPVRFVANIDIGSIWFREFDFQRYSWSRSVLPVIGLGVDFRIPIVDKISICTGIQYMAAFEGFEVNAKEYNSVQATIGMVYDGAMVK